MIRFTLFLLCLASGVALSAPPDSATTTDYNAPAWVATRSLVLPGWGQLHNGKTVKALVYGGAQVGMGFGIYRQNQEYQKAIGDRNALTDTLRRAEFTRIAEFYHNDRNKLIWWVSGVTLLSVFDAFTDAHLAHFDVGPALSSNGTPVAQITWLWERRK